MDDGSSDGTADLAEDLRRRYPALSVLRRSTNLGLSAAIVDGFWAARGDILCVMDADLQHDPSVLPELLSGIANADIAIGSRYAFRGRTCGWPFARMAQSRLAACVTRHILGLPVRDPLSGFFMMRRDLFTSISPRLSTVGWKILLEILVASPFARIIEIPFTFRARRRGHTKMNGRVVAAWAKSLMRLRRTAQRDGLVRPIRAGASS